MKPKRLKPSRVVAITLLFVYIFISLPVVMFLFSIDLINGVALIIMVFIDCIIMFIMLALDNTW